MQANPVNIERPRSLTETARREQIVQATIRTLAEVGYARTSYARIARSAGLSSTGMISYHFASKGELMSEVVMAVVGGIGRYVQERMERTTSPAEALRTYILATTAYIGAHREAMQALLAVVLSGAMTAGTGSFERAADAIEDILRAGQAAGQFRDFDVGVMTSVIQRSIEGLPVLLAHDPDFDVAGYSRELADLFDHATRRTKEG